MKRKNNNLKWVIALITLLVFMWIVLSIFKKDIIEFDTFYYKHISKLISDKMTFVVKILTDMSNGITLISITLLIMLFFKEKIYGILVGINLVTIYLFNLFLKFIFARPRPIDINLIDESGYSFPSGHAMVSTAFYGLIMYMIWKSNLNKRVKVLYFSLLFILIILISLSRIYLGVHYASDVFGGVLISTSYLILFTSAVSKYLPNKKSSK